MERIARAPKPTTTATPFTERQLAEFVEAAQTGDKSALRHVIASAMDYLFPVVLSMLYERRGRGTYITETLHTGGSDVVDRLQDDAWAVTHAACCRIALRIDTFRGRNAWGRKVQFTTWMYAIAQNEMRTLLRDRWREHKRYGGSRDESESGAVGASGGVSDGQRPIAGAETADSSFSTPELAAMDKVRSDLLRTALEEAPLTPEQREAVVLFHGYGYRQEQIATLTGVQVGTVKKRVFDGLRKLRTYMETTTDSAGALPRPAESSQGGMADE